MSAAVMAPYYDACIDGLFSQTVNHRKREAIQAEFQYPFSSADGYFAWTRLGGTGPAPQDWCRRYAYMKVTTPYGQGLSLN